MSPTKANSEDTEKLEAIKQQEEHLKTASQERALYQEQISSARAIFDLSLKNTVLPQPPNSFASSQHYSFDFAQQVMYPSNPLQPGPIYFMVPKRCGLFGVHSEGANRQHNYMIDEAVSVGKGANTVISLLHHYLDHYSYGEQHLHLHADNCSGQNKNNTMLQYLMWRIHTGRNSSVSLHFMIAGHTKFAVDWGFGLLKRKFRKTKVDCLADLAKVINDSSHVTHKQLCFCHHQLPLFAKLYVFE
ncbi:hypothetical protein CAPTEDRAFT_214547 [Capitella teleta]|uniref:DUF7869 domain-containing protein n=1 Tax=Capitella teleta TaxID=283909 RepID=R7TQ15_CAPTE|nr:hypothetical protein CAPTEDRAFT_214547 [Capitella teleta]|eukprot:ELT95744.1 hypothetical protein CAPTEDRAFT_214547 [Capitella teleta]